MENRVGVVKRLGKRGFDVGEGQYEGFFFGDFDCGGG